MISIRKKLEDAAGILCKAFLPIKQEYYFGSGKSDAICTLSSTDLLESISTSPIMEKVLIAGRLLSENRGIDAIVNFAMNYPELRRIIVCGNEVKGHRAGQALIALARNGVNSQGRIIGASGPNPIVTQPRANVGIFRNQVRIIDLIGKVDVAEISRILVA
ncbi:MAG: tetrahydromethanopterin S-methyltransferase subunit A [Thermoproteota archaeon]|nr:tetrahydromethanopterin S-methyltransferase subunit A [Thermoproteota archaeon]